MVPSCKKEYLFHLFHLPGFTSAPEKHWSTSVYKKKIGTFYKKKIKKNKTSVYKKHQYTNDTNMPEVTSAAKKHQSTSLDPLQDYDLKDLLLYE